MAEAREKTRGDVGRQPPPWSQWRTTLVRRAGSVPLDDWLVEQANLRGFHGAYVSGSSGLPIDPDLTLEDIVVGLCQPQAPAETRALKLVVRLIQSGRLDVDRLVRLARRERADFVLHWLLGKVPTEERTAELEAVADRFRDPPRGYREPAFAWDPRRLIHRRARR